MILLIRLLRNRITIIYQILIDLFVYFLLIVIFNKFEKIEVINYINIYIWIFLSFIFDRYHLREYKYKLLLNYFFKTIFIYSILLMINISSINIILILTIHLICSLFIQPTYIKLNYKDIVKVKKWITNDNRLIQLYKSKSFSFRNHKIYLFDKNSNYDYSNYCGFILDNSASNYESIKIILNKNKTLKSFFSLNWCEIYLESLPLDFISSSILCNNLNEINYINNIKLFSSTKRLFEYIFSLILIICSLPLIAFFAILIYFQDGIPIFYSQVRTGIDKTNIRIFKIRSMRNNSEVDGPQWSKKDDPRITFIGKLIRKNRIDELPQLISVIKGDLSLIGPRPERPEIDQILKKDIFLYDKRYSVKPGITGWAQVNYPYGASLDDALIKQSYDLYYVKNFSFALDFIIFLKTIRLIFNRRGAIPIGNE